MANSSPRRKTAKPRADFPIFPHQGSKRWCKKVRGRHVYFETLEKDPKGVASLELWLEQKDDLLAGREPRNSRDALTIKDLANLFLAYKTELIASGELTERTLKTYTDAAQQLVDIIGKHRTVDDIGPDDFAKVRVALARRYKPVSLTNRIQVVRSIFKYGYDAGLLEKPARFGMFKKPRAKVIRETRIAKGAQDFTAHEVRCLLKVATVNLRGMILLGVQCGFGNTDCGELEESAIDLGQGWLDWPRQKTATHRRCPLWPETIAAVRDAMEQRPAGSSLVFIGRRGEDYIGDRNGYRVSREFQRAARDAGIVGKGFYCLRRTFQTVGEDSGDLAAVKAMMGHIPSESDMSARYRQRISDERLMRVADHLHSWLWPRPLVGKGGEQ